MQFGGAPRWSLRDNLEFARYPLKFENREYMVQFKPIMRSYLSRDILISFNSIAVAVALPTMENQVNFSIRIQICST